MGKTTIEWTATYNTDGTVTPGYTFNPWWGCQHVSPGCTNCFAETLSHRYGHNVWGSPKTTGRREMSANYWKQPIKWNDAARKAGQRARVFCASMADVFEDHPQLDWPRTNLWGLIETTPHLDWLLLTKRPENMTRMAPASWGNGWPKNIIAMTSVEDQRRADERIPKLLKVPARRRGLSCEPLLEAIDLSPWLFACCACEARPDRNDSAWRIGYEGWEHMCDHPQAGYFDTNPLNAGIHWVIAGGESGHGARPCHPDWARSLRDQCRAAQVPFFWKQWGEWLPFARTRDEDGSERLVGGDGRRIFALDLLHHNHEIHDDLGIVRVGKHAAGRLLDGVEHNAYPGERG